MNSDMIDYEFKSANHLKEIMRNVMDVASNAEGVYCDASKEYVEKIMLW